jgi:prepilin peptidase CpaA
MTLWPIMVTAAFLLPLLAAASWDVACFRIPNILSAALVLLFVPAVALAPVSVPWGWHLAAALAVLIVGAGLFALHLLGGGDVKLLSAAALWLGMTNLAGFLVLVSLAGAALTALVLVLRAPLCRRAFSGLGLEPAVLRPRAGIPYGVAIAMGAALLVGRLPMMGG